jgi:hypothetical protein
VRLLSIHGFHRKALLLTLAGVALCVVFATINYLKYRGVVEALQTLGQRKSLEMPPSSEWSKSLSPIDREQLGQTIARDAYLHLGKITTYTDRSNLEKSFTPNQDELHKRETKVVDLAQLNSLAQARLTDAIEWILWGVFAVLCGLTLRRPSNNDR